MEEVNLIQWSACALIIAFGSWLILGYTRTKRLPPGPPGLPILGSLLELGSKPHESLANLASKYGPLMTLRVGKVTIIVVTSPTLTKEVLKTQDQITCGRHIPCVVEGLSYSYSDSSMVLAQPGPYWQLLRRVSTAHLFNKNTLDSLRSLRKLQVERMIAKIYHKEDGGGGIHVAEIVFGCVLNIIGNMVFGRDIDPCEKEVKELMGVVRELTTLGGTPNISDYFPILKPFDLQGLKGKAKKCYKKMYDTLDDLIEIYKREQQMEGVKKDDLVSTLLDYKDNQTLTMENIRGYLAGIFNAATDTTTTTIEWIMAELIENPNILRRVKQELDDVVGSERRVREEDCEKLVYLKATVKETFRLHPATPFLIPHRALEDVQISGYTVPKDSKILVNVWATARDSCVWSNPMVFEPERFLDDKNSEIDYRGQHFELIPFGAGRRICIGLPLANIMIHYILASLLHSFDWSLPKDVTKVDMSEKFGVVLQKLVPLHIVSTPCRPSSLYETSA